MFPAKTLNNTASFVYLLHGSPTLPTYLHHEEEMPLFPGLLKGLQGRQLQLRVKMEPADYLWVSIIVATLILSRTENWELAMSRLS